MEIQNKIKLCDGFIEKYSQHRTECRICPRNCGVDRSRTLGECQEPFLPRIASANLHKGEEPPISGSKGSGTIFFTGCNLHCVFCQNFPISQHHMSNLELTIPQLAAKMLELQTRGAHNINFVTPSHVVLSMVMALKIAYEQGLKIPLVYNTSGYDLPAVVTDLEGIIDIWLPDAKYADDAIARQFSDAPGYVAINRKNLIEMYRQKGTRLDLDDQGILQEGLIIRHLLLPGQLENSKKVLEWISDSLNPNIHLSIMSQYFPAYKTATENTYSSLNRKIEIQEYEDLLDYAESLGLTQGWWQDPDLNGGA